MKKTTGSAGGAPARSVTAYIAAAPAASRAMLKQLRGLIRAGAPNAEEVISYRMPMYKYHGMLLGFAAFEHHVGFYAISTAIQKAHAAELVGFKTGKRLGAVSARQQAPGQAHQANGRGAGRREPAQGRS